MGVKLLKDTFPIFLSLLFVLILNAEEDACIVLQVHINRLESLAYNSFRWYVICLSNAMPEYIVYIYICNLSCFVVNVPLCSSGHKYPG